MKSGLQLDWIEKEYEEIQADRTEDVSRNSCEKLSSSVEGDFFLEDTGIFIDALKGFPGVYSSYVQKTIGNEGIIRLVENVERGANFKTVVTARVGGVITQYTGVLKGEIISEERGDEGFGYDPIFIPEGEVKTLAEMTVDEKNMISHRFRAVKQLISDLK